VAVGLSTTYWELALARALNGVGLAVVLPSIQSFVADTHSAEQRGSGFGWLQFTNYSGRVVGLREEVHRFLQWSGYRQI
jgi:MFS family permease